MPYIFKKDYIDTRNGKTYPKGIVLKVINYEVLSSNGEWVFDVDSHTAAINGKVISKKKKTKK